MAADRVFRKGTHYLQGENGWGQRSCATRMTLNAAARELKYWETISPHCAIEMADGEAEQLWFLSPVDPKTTGTKE